MIDNYGLWKKHDRLMAETEEKHRKLNKVLDMAIEGVELAVVTLQTDFMEGIDVLENLIEKLEGER